MARYDRDTLAEVGARVVLPANVTALFTIGNDRLWAACADRIFREISVNEECLAVVREFKGPERTISIGTRVSTSAGMSTPFIK